MVRLISPMTTPVGETAQEPGGARQRLPCVAFVAGAFVVCLIRLAGFVEADAVNVFFEDQWDFLRPLFERRGPLSCFFWQHGPHRQGLGGVIDWFLFNATGWNNCSEAWAAFVVLSLATIVAIALAVRLRGHLSWIDASFPLLILSPIHWETMVLTPNLAHSILPLLLTLLLAYVWGPAGPACRIIGACVFGTLALFTGFGSCCFPVVVCLAFLLLLRPGNAAAPTGRRQLLAILIVLAVASAGFALGYHWNPAVPGWRFPVPEWWDYPRFCALMFTGLIGWRTISIPSTIVGFAMLSLVTAAFVVAATAIWRRRATPRLQAVFVLIGTSLVYAVLTAIGRLPITLQAAFMWRYATLMTPALCGLVLAFEGIGASRGPGFRSAFIVGWLALSCVIWSDLKPERYGAAIAEAKKQWAVSYLRTHDLDAANRSSGFAVYSPSPASPEVAAHLRWLEKQHLSFFRDPPDGSQ